MSIAYEHLYPYTVTIKNVGRVRVLAQTKWVAIDKAYTQYRHLQPKRMHYNAIRVKPVKQNTIKR